MKSNIDIPIEPYIELDGGYACCPNDHEEVQPMAIQTRCNKCGQLIDWSWMKKFEVNNAEKEK